MALLIPLVFFCLLPPKTAASLSLEVSSLARADTVYAIVELKPEFPGGLVALDQFLNTHLHYPAEALKYRSGGSVHVNLVISNTGKTQNAIVLKGAGLGLDQEALRLISLLQNWAPGKINEKPVNSEFQLALHFDAAKQTAHAVESRQFDKVFFPTLTPLFFEGEPVYYHVKDAPNAATFKEHLFSLVPGLKRAIKKGGEISFILTKSGTISQIEFSSVFGEKQRALITKSFQVTFQWVTGKLNGQPVHLFMVLRFLPES